MHKLLRRLVAVTLVIALFSCKEGGKDSEIDSTPMTSVIMEEMENEAWQMEELYWTLVQNNDTIAYKKLWHDQFIGYPSFGDGVSDKSRIASWIPELHANPDEKFSYQLYRKASNAIDDIVIVFYDADQIWTDKNGQVLRKETDKFTHTWKKYGDTWLILGGMAAIKTANP